MRILLCLIFFTSMLSLQASKLDSLRSIIKGGVDDTGKVIAIQELARQYYISNNDSMHYYLRKARDLSISLDYDRGISKAYYLKAYYFCFRVQQYDSASYFIEKSLEAANNANCYKCLAASYKIEGRLNERKKDYAGAITSMNYAAALYKKIGNTDELARCYHNISWYKEYGFKDFGGSIHYSDMALELYKEEKDTVNINMLLLSKGRIYYHIGEYDEALELYNQSLHLMKESKNLDGEMSALNHLGLLFVHRKEYNRSLEVLVQAKKIAIALKDTKIVAFVNNNMGEVYIELDQVDTAEYYFDKSYETAEYLNSDYVRSSNFNGYGLIHEKRGNIDKALEYYLKSRKILDRFSYFDKEEVNLKGLYNCYKKKKNHKEALYFHEKLIFFMDSINRRETAIQIASLNLKNDLTNKEKELEYQKVELKASEEEREKNQAQRNLIFLGLIGVGLVAFLLFRTVKVKQRSFEIIANQKKEVEKQRDIVNEKNLEILSSIEYAKKIQSAILPQRRIVKDYLSNSFIYFRPKDIVSGDFYWFDTIGDDIYFSAADCTGHGVPGAMVSVVCSNSLTKTVRELKISKPSAILDKVTEIVEERFGAGEDDVVDGMDLALCKLNLKENKLEFSGAHNPLWIIRNGELKEYKGTPQPIGKFFARESFVNHEIQVEKGDTIYVFSDGFQDQFGGERGKKYKPANFKKFLISIQDKSMEEQRELINAEFERYKGDEEQIDDVCVIGVRV